MRTASSEIRLPAMGVVAVDRLDKPGTQVGNSWETLILAFDEIR
jgi:hypothetical protein